MDEDKKKARLRRAQRMTLMNGAQEQTITGTYDDGQQPSAPDSTTVFQETDPLCAALDELCSALNFWYGSMNNPWQREDKVYRRQLAKNLRDKLKQVISDESGEESQHKTCREPNGDHCKN